ncbi:MAG: hypothetical protein PVF83_06420 [Anaerolineales bacterium]|jgi:hypothetical protein
MKWLLFLPQLPASPSTLRVMVWRRMRTAGALGIQNGVWLLPQKPEQIELLEELSVYLQEHEASSYIFEVNALNQSIEDEIIEQLRGERDEEYSEFCERGDALLAELERESKQEKFTFAELEETEEDLRKLSKWLKKINARDFFGGHKQDEASENLERCENAHQVFADKVYEHQGINPSNKPDE